MATMKAISIDPEYVLEIANGTKNEEYRKWSTSYRGDIIICTLATSSTYGFADLIAEIYDCEKQDGIYAFKLRNVKALKPFIVRGQQRIYNLAAPDDMTIYEPGEHMMVEEHVEFFKIVHKKPPAEEEIERFRAAIEAELSKIYS